MDDDDSKARPGAGCANEVYTFRPRFGMRGQGGYILYLCVDLRVATDEVVPVLRRAGYRVKAVQINEFTMRSWYRARWLLVLLDFTYLDSACFRLCARLRAMTRTPIMAVLRGSASHDVLRVFNAGADAVMPVSVSQREFLARVEAVLRRRPLYGHVH